MMKNPISGFYKKSKEEKIQWLQANYFKENPETIEILPEYWHIDPSLQELHDEFIENTISNFFLPLGVAPNFLINGELYAIPMSIEESSVVAAASNSARFWISRGGFKTEVLSSTKNGQIHITYTGESKDFFDFFDTHKSDIIESISEIQKNMQKRGGGLLELELQDKTQDLADYYQLHATFETLDAMGANFINSCLEAMANKMEELAKDYPAFKTANKFPFVEMSILSNYVPECVVRAEVSCKVEDLAHNDITGEEFARRIHRAVAIAKANPRRAVTHNKGIMNGIDAVVIATGNDFRAIEAGAHAYASKDGNYSSLTHCSIEDDTFRFWIDIPLALGTVGGLTSLHPMVKFSLDLLQNPSGRELMEITAVAGLAQNFAALRSLVTVGIQQGHMKMHLTNILNQLGATEEQKGKANTYFAERAVSFKAVEDFLEENPA